jgi:hypothetical protein
MKKLILSLVLLGSSSVFAGGDLGGIGAKAYELTPAEVVEIQKSPDAITAYTVWVSKFDRKRQELLLKSVFEEKVVPQLVVPAHP